VHRISNRDSHISCNPGYAIGGQVLCQSNKARDLVFIIDDKLNFNGHVFVIAYKAHVRCLSNTSIILFPEMPMV